MVARLPQITGSKQLAPTSLPSVAVTTQTPLQAVQAKGYGDLSARMDQLSTYAFKIAGAQAKAKGTVYGAQNAPTLAQLQDAARTGRPVKLPGDPSSMDVFQQAAYAGALSVVEDRYEIAGRRQLTQAMAEVTSNPTIDPIQVTKLLDDVVTNWTNSLSLVSATSAAKVGASLSLVANSQLVSFSREYMRIAADSRKTETMNNAFVIIDDTKELIRGHTSGTEVSLATVLEAQKSRITNSLLQDKNITHSQLQGVMRQFDKTVAEERSAALVAWVTTSTDFRNDPTGAFKEIMKHQNGEPNSLPEYLQDIYDTMGAHEKVQVWEEVAKHQSMLVGQDALVAQATALANDQIILTSELNFLTALRENDTAGMQTAIEAMETVDPTGARRLRKILEVGRGRLVSDQETYKGLKALLSLNHLTLHDIALKAGDLATDDIISLMGDVGSQRDAKFIFALGLANTAFQPDLDIPAHLLTDEKAFQRLKYERASEKLYAKKAAFEREISILIRRGTDEGEPYKYITKGDFFNANTIMEMIIEQVREEETKIHIKKLNRAVQKALTLFHNIDEDIRFEILKNRQPSKKVLEDAVLFGKRLEWDGSSNSANVRIMTKGITAVESLEDLGATKDIQWVLSVE